jgi:Zn-finger nucleic acid-binding protein
MALAEVKANECPRCGGPLDQTTDTEHVAWDVTYDECNRCETVAYTQAKDSGTDDKEARKQAQPAGRLYRAIAVLNPEPERR